MGRLMDVYKTIKNCLSVAELTRQDTANSSIIMPTRKNITSKHPNGQKKTEKEPMPSQEKDITRILSIVGNIKESTEQGRKRRKSR